jgi:hypothetical protein
LFLLFVRGASPIVCYGAARGVRNYAATVDSLQSVYNKHLLDQRLRATYGDDYQNIRICKSNMTVLELEKRVLDLQQSETNKAYEIGLDLAANGRLKLSSGRFNRGLGVFIDDRVRGALRGMARAEGISESAASTLWAINRKIERDGVIGFPDNRLGLFFNIDTTIALKHSRSRQIKNWDYINGGYTLIVRPEVRGGLT